MKLSIIIPCYNEFNTIEKLINEVNKIKIKKQVIIVDDFSDDGSRKIIKKIKKKYDKAIYHKKNLGKGAAINSAKKFIKGQIILIQDADLEYSPKDYKKLIEPIIKGKTNVVYGSRVLKKSRYINSNFSSAFRVFANHVLTIISNIINSQNLTDAHTCYKVLKSDLFKKIKLKEKGFSFCPELTTKISLAREKIIEVQIRYNGRTYAEGKKINVFDGFHAIKTLIKYRFF
tara:strand:+ start:38 stop:727 length:690 start_codon:yes stop_codon:yes gene_type:complete